MAYIVKIDYKKIEQKWKQKWIDSKIFEPSPDKRKKCFVTFPFPYVNGPLHIGHGFTLTRLDVYARFKRMQGNNVLFPFAFHATGEPILGVAERLEKGDEVIKRILKDDGVTEKEFNKFKDPKYIARYWEKRIKNDVENAGASADWSRRFTTIDPDFNRFIEWQYNLLKDSGYVFQGTHPVVWCPHDKSPTGDHDRLEGEGEGPVEYVVYKFKMKSGDVLPTATLRPETIFGVTNVWIHPDVEYVKAEVDGEMWVVSELAVAKLKDQLHHVEVKGKIKGEKLIGEKATNPISKNEILVLPATFIDPNITTGIVMSVPSHAPYDWIALKDLVKKEKELEDRYRINKEDLKKIKPISVIKVEGFGEHPAIEFCEKIGIRDQEDKQHLDEATGIIYKKEYHKGILKEIAGKYRDLQVSQCKKKLSEDFMKQGTASQLLELTNKVVCRCGTRCHVKVLEKQWFLKFSSQDWKKKVRECVKMMKFYPEQARKHFEEIVEWLEDKACARRSGLGTRLPWDHEWIVETLSDSVIYMAFYTISKYIHSEKIEPHQLKKEFFDYVFLGKGIVDKVAEETGLNKQKLKVIRREFEYWYGMDLRGSAKELVPNHLTYSIFHHVAIWPNDKNKWPKSYTINGMQQLKGQKMSKSKGNYITLQDAIDKYSVDAVRATLMDANEGMEDPDWTEQTTLAWRSKLNSLYSLAEKYYGKGATANKGKIDVWIESSFQNYIKVMTQNLEELKNRSALANFHKMLNDFQWYLKRVDKPNKATVNYVLETMTKVLSIYSPFICEEIWELMGKKGFVSISEWPKFNGKIIDVDIIQMEEILKKAEEDIREIIKLSGKNKNLYLYVASPKEFSHFKDAESFLKREFKFEKVRVFQASDPNKHDPQGKAKRSKFGKPGIYVE